MAPTNPFHDSQTTTTANNVHPSDGLPEDQIPSEPPPAYTPSATTGTGESTVQAGPLRPDFSGPPPMPDWVERQQQQQQFTGGSGVGVNLTGVGMGYGHGGQAHSQGQYANGNSSSDETKPPPPPRHPSATSSSARPPPPLPSRDSTTQPSSSQSAAPTEAPTPGRPLLHRGQMLVYPGGFWCSKCNNTGYKANDPSNPHERDWKKYGRVYNSTLAHSYTQALSAGLQMSDNFQKPLPSYAPAGHAPASVPYSGPTSAQYSHLPPPPGSSGKWSTYPGQGQGPGQSYSHLPPPPQRQQQLQYPAPGQQIFVQRTAGMAPPGALVVAPGDPRIGGRLCWRCNGSGTEILFFGFDEGRCSTCSGLGRLF